MLSNSRFFSRSRVSVSVMFSPCVRKVGGSGWQAQSVSGERTKSLVHVIGAGRQQMLRYGIDMAIAPVLQRRAFDPLVECPDRRARMNLIIHALFAIAFQGKAHRMNEIPAKDHRHLYLVVPLCPFDLGGMRLHVEVFRLAVHLVEARSEERRVGKECVSTCKYRWTT